MVILGGYEKDYHPGHIRNVSTIYISGILHSSQGNYGMATVNYAPTMSNINISGGTTPYDKVGVTGSAVYTGHWKNKTIYISSNIGTSCTYPTGAIFYIEGCPEDWGNVSWYLISSADFYTSAKNRYYYNTEEHHPYMRTRMVSGQGGPSGTYMTIITASN